MKKAVKPIFWPLDAFLTLLKLLFVLFTLVRLLFLVMIILRNRFPNSFLAKKLFKNSIFISEDKKLERKLPWKRCIHIAFKQALKDLPYVPIAFLVIFLAPWRIITITSIVMSQIDRIPAQDIDAKKLKLYSRRAEVITILKKIPSDYICLLHLIVVILTVYRLRFVLNHLKTYLTNYRRYSTGVTIP